MRRIAKLLLLTLIIVLVSPGLAAAQNNTPKVTISPFLREVRFSATDGTKEFDVEISNDSTLERSFTFSVLDFGSLQDTGGIVFAGSNAGSLVKKYGLANWLQLSKKNLSIGPGKSAKIVATIIDDVSLTPGGHYAAIVASVDAPLGSTSNQVSVDQKLSSLIFAVKTGGETYDLKLDKIEAGSNLFNLPSSVTLHFSNPGNVHVVPRGTVKLLSPSGKVISQGIINEESSFVLPETPRQMLVNLRPMSSKGLWPSAYTVQVDYRYDGMDHFARKDHKLYILNFSGFLILIIMIAAAIWAELKLKLARKIGRFLVKTYPKIRQKL